MKNINPVRTFARRGRDYLELVGWLLSLVYRGRAGSLVAATTFGATWLVTQGAAIGLVYGYAHVLQTGGIVSHLPFVVDLRSSVPWLVATVAAASLLMLVSNVAFFCARMAVMRAASAAYRAMLDNIVLNFWRLPDSRAPVASRIVVERGITGFYTGAKMTASSAQLLGSTLPSLVGSVLASVVLFWIDWKLTLLIAVSLAVQALAVYMPMLRAAKVAKAATAARKEQMRVLAPLKWGLSPGNGADVASALDGMASGFVEARSTRRRLRLASAIASTGVLALAIAYIAVSLMGALNEWPRYLAYIGALQIALRGVTRSTSILASISRFYQRIQHFRAFSDEMRGIDRRPLNAVDPTLPIFLSDGNTWRSIPPGTLLASGVAGDYRAMMFALLGAQQKDNRDLAKAYIPSLDRPASPGELTVVTAFGLRRVGTGSRAWLTAAKDAGASVVILYGAGDLPHEVPGFEESMLLLVDDDGNLNLVVRGDTNWDEGVERLQHLMRRSRRAQGDEGSDDADDEDDDEDF